MPVEREPLRWLAGARREASEERAHRFRPCRVGGPQADRYPAYVHRPAGEELSSPPAVGFGRPGGLGAITGGTGAVLGEDALEPVGGGIRFEPLRPAVGQGRL